MKIKKAIGVVWLQGRNHQGLSQEGKEKQEVCLQGKNNLSNT